MGRRVIIDTEKAARKMRQTFMDREVKRKRVYDWDWPTTLREVGTCEAVMYSSDKWRKPRDFVDYKHVSEGQQLLYTVPGFIVGAGRVPGRSVRLSGEMPDSIALLAPIIGIQTRLYVRRGKSYYLPNGDESLYQLDIPRAKLGGIEDPETKATYLVVYTDDEGILCLITGSKLAVEKDGIVG
jgi:hypothetical protein